MQMFRHWFLSLKISHYKHGPWERVLKFQIGLKKLQQQKRLDKEKIISSQLLLRTSLMDLLGFHHQGFLAYKKLLELSQKGDSSVLLSLFKFTGVPCSQYRKC